MAIVRAGIDTYSRIGIVVAIVPTSSISADNKHIAMDMKFVCVASVRIYGMLRPGTASNCNAFTKLWEILETIVRWGENAIVVDEHLD